MEKGLSICTNYGAGFRWFEDILTSSNLQDFVASDSGSKSPEAGGVSGANQKLSSTSFEASLPQHSQTRNRSNQSNNGSEMESIESAELLGDVSKVPILVPPHTCPVPTSCIKVPTAMCNVPAHSARRNTVWRRTSVSICFMNL